MMEILLDANQHVPQAMGQRIGDPALAGDAFLE
jgi:hypothetical protein